MGQLSMNRYSIIHDMKYCYACGRPAQHIHEVFYGSANRQKSIEYGLCVGLCVDHHVGGTKAVHNHNWKLKMEMQVQAQEKFIEKYSYEKFMEVFRRDYIAYWEKKKAEYESYDS